MIWLYFSFGWRVSWCHQWSSFVQLSLLNQRQKLLCLIKVSHPSVPFLQLKKITLRMFWRNCMTTQTIQSLQCTTVDNCNSLREIKLRSLESHHLVPYVRLKFKLFLMRLSLPFGKFNWRLCKCNLLGVLKSNFNSGLLNSSVRTLIFKNTHFPPWKCDLTLSVRRAIIPV